MAIGSKKNILLLIPSLFFASCFQHYFRTNTRYEADTAIIEGLRSANKYFIIHSGSRVMGTDKLSVKNNLLEADLVLLPKEHSYYSNPNTEKENFMKANRQKSTLMEVHIYTKIAITANQQHISLPLSDIHRFDIYEFDAKATRDNRTTSIIGISLGATLLSFYFGLSTIEYY
jgi:hypothetical protein